MQKERVNTIVGVGLVILAIVAFLVMIIVNLPHDAQVSQLANPLPSIPQNMFADSNPLIQSIKGLSVPANVPVTVTNNNLGRDNAFEGF